MTTIEDIMEFYERSDADVLKALDGESAGVLWMLPPCSPENLKQGIRQLVRCKATRIQWIRKLKLNSRSAGLVEAAGIYLLPSMDQHIYRLDNGVEMTVDPLQDACFTAARSVMMSAAG